MAELMLPGVTQDMLLERTFNSLQSQVEGATHMLCVKNAQGENRIFSVRAMAASFLGSDSLTREFFLQELEDQMGVKPDDMSLVEVRDLTVPFPDSKLVL